MGERRFPDGFVWGTATASYQIEGGRDERGDCIWDTFCRWPGKVVEGHTGDVADDHYHRFREDVALMADLGMRAYRFSVSWQRVLPSGAGRPSVVVLDFYDLLVDVLLAHDIAPFVTLYHWDLPVASRTSAAARDTAQRYADYAAPSPGAWETASGTGSRTTSPGGGLLGTIRASTPGWRTWVSRSRWRTTSCTPMASRCRPSERRARTRRWGSP